MPRLKRVCPRGEVFHVLNRAVARLTIFDKPADYDAFLRVIAETWEIVPLPIFAMVLMPNHWHFILRPTTNDQVSEFFRRLTVMHTMRYHAHYQTSGTGHLSRSVQVLPDSKRRTPSDGHAVCRTTDSDFNLDRVAFWPRTGDLSNSRSQAHPQMQNSPFTAAVWQAAVQ
jgi:putative transposase